MTQHVAAPSRPSGTPIPIAATLVVGQIPGQPPGFVDRSELSQVRRELDARGRVVVCAGGRGVGKTAVAAAYARAAIADPAGPQVVVWVSGESLLTLTTGLAALAHRVNLSVEDEDVEHSAARARDYLTGLDVACLLVIDNAENPHHISDWLPAGGTCQVLLTSTDQAFSALATPVQVGTYTRAQSVAYLQERTGLTDPDGAAAIADALGDLPLALAQAAGVIHAQGLTYPRYLTKLTSAALAAVLPAIPGYPRGLAEAVLLSVQAVTGRHPLAQATLDLLCVLDPNGVTRDLLTDLLRALQDTPAHQTASTHEPESPGNFAQSIEDTIDEVIAALAGLSLITRTANRSAVVMHRMNGRVIRETGALAQLLDHAAEALFATIPGPGAEPPTSTRVADLTA